MKIALYTITTIFILILIFINPILNTTILYLMRNSGIAIEELNIDIYHGYINLSKIEIKRGGFFVGYVNIPRMEVRLKPMAIFKNRVDIDSVDVWYPTLKVMPGIIQSLSKDVKSHNNMNGHDGSTAGYDGRAYYIKKLAINNAKFVFNKEAKTIDNLSFDNLALNNQLFDTIAREVIIKYSLDGFTGLLYKALSSNPISKILDKDIISMVLK